MVLDALLLLGPISDLLTALRSGEKSLRAPHKIRVALRPLGSLLQTGLSRHPASLNEPELYEYQASVETLGKVAKDAHRVSPATARAAAELIQALSAAAIPLGTGTLYHSEVFSLLQQVRELASGRRP
jgi:hypothetical protein